MKVKTEIRLRDRIFTKPVNIFLLLVLFLILWQFYNFLVQKYCLSLENFTKKQIEYEKVLLRKNKVNQDLSFAQSEKGQEKMLRGQNALGREGERMLILTGDFIDQENEIEEVKSGLTQWQEILHRIQDYIHICQK